MHDVAFANTDREVRSLLQRLFALAIVQPEAVALQFPGGRLTYQEMASAVDALALSLAALGAARRDIVAIESGKAPASYLLMFAAWRLGAVALLIDNSLPAQRRADMRKLAAFHAFVIGGGGGHDQSDDSKSIAVTKEGHVVTTPEVMAPIPYSPTDIASTEPAYVVFTSGTSGEPKAAIGTHAGLWNFASWQMESLPAGREDRVAQIASLSFDAMFKDVTLAIANGATLMIPFDRPLNDADALLSWIESESITVVQTVPSVVNAWLSSGVEAKLSGVRVLCLSGEPLSGGLVTAVRERWPAWRPKIFNLYGLTEATILQTALPICDGPLPQGPLSIGRAIARHRVEVKDTNGNPCDIGQIGEVLIRTRYGCEVVPMDRLRDTIAAWSYELPERTYRTGDLGRLSFDDELMLVGRRDDVLKLRGVRIHPLEVQAAILRQPDIASCAVVPFRQKTGDVVLSAYVVPRGGAPFDENKLLAQLEARLPRAAVPSYIVLIDRLPLTRNGKLDVGRLPDPLDGRERGKTDAGWDSASPKERQIAEIWAQLLGHHSFGPQDNFFRIGGHSLLAVQAISRLRSAFAAKLTIKDFFEAPVVRRLAARIETRAGGGAPPPLVRLAGRDRYPLSIAQRGLWFLYQFDPKSTAYNMSGLIRVGQPINRNDFRDALARLISRHEALRTVIGEGADGLEQRVLPALSPRIRFEDFSALDRHGVETALQQVLAEEKAHAFDLTTGPVLAAVLVALSDGSSAIALVLHHIVCDGWSWRILVRELTADLQRAPPPPVAFQMGDYAIWEQQNTSQEQHERDLAWWRARLTPAPTLLRLPRDPCAVRGAARDGVCTRLFEWKLMGDLQETARNLEVTPFVILLAAFELLLARQTSETDITIGTDSAGRDSAEIEGTVGFFIRTLLVRIQLSPQQTARQLIDQVRESVIGAQAAHSVPFEELVRLFAADRRPDENPLFEIMFRMPPRLPSETEGAERNLVSIVSGEGDAKFDLTFVVDPHADALQVTAEFRPQRFTADRIGALIDRYAEIVRWMNANPDAQLLRFGREVGCDVFDCIREPLRVSPSPGVIETIVSHLAERSQAIAIECGPRKVSYGELWRNTERLAADLLGSDLKIGQVVAVSGTPSIASVTGFLAVLRAGGIGLFVDPSLPELRRREMVAAANPVMWIAAAGEDVPGRMVRVDSWGRPKNSVGAASSQPLPEVASLRTAKAYLFFTSGSLGLPKGVIGNHAGLANFLSWQRRSFAVGSSDRVAQLIAVSFDAVLRDIFLPLSAGGTLVIPEKAETETPSALRAWLARSGITVVHTVPSVFANLVSGTPEPGWHPAVRVVFASGEPLARSLVRRARVWFPADRTRIVNLYGSTECTMIQAAYMVDEVATYEIQPIGSPVDNTQNIVLDEHDGICAVGEMGEIVTRGPLGRCAYLHPPDADGSGFCCNPFRSDPEDLLYRTRDAGRLNPDRTISLVGRLDDQVKVRGVRVNLLEVQYLLGAHPDVIGCHVLAQENPGGATELAAYVVPVNEQHPPSAAVLQKHLATFLHGASVPTHWTFLDRLPLLPNGKIDRAALRRLDQPALSGATSALRRPGPTERRVMEIWRDALGANEFGLDQSFFTIGGHSLLATVVVARMREAFRVELPLRTIFEHNTVESLAAEIDRISLHSSKEPYRSESIVPFTRRQDGRRLFLVHPIGGSAGCYVDLATALGEHVVAIGLNAPGLSDKESPIDDLRALAHFHLEAFREAYDDQCLALLGWSFGGLVAYEMARQAQERGLHIELLAMVDTYAPVDGAYPPLAAHSAEIARALLGDLATIADRDARQILEDLLDAQNCPDWDQLVEILTALPNIGGLLTRESILRRRNLIWSHWTAASTYKFRQLKQEISMLLIVAESEKRQVLADDALGWRSLIHGGLRVEHEAAKHRTILSPPHVSRMADLLRTS
jgi:amino acid adenylation domain-containing protein